MKALIYLFMLGLFATVAFAYQGPYTPGQNIAFPSNCLDANKIFIDSTQNITISYPNGTVWLANVSMTNVSTGQFIANLTLPNVTGTYSVKKTCYVTGGSFAQGGDTFEIVDYEGALGLAGIALMIGLLGLTGSLFYLSYRHNRMTSMQRLLAPFLHIGGIWSLLLPLLYISNNGIIDPMGDTLLYIGLVFIILYTAIYMPISMLIMIGDFISEQGKIKGWRGAIKWGFDE